MNGIGIEHQRYFTQICLREGSGPHARFRSVGDGAQRLIVNAAGPVPTAWSRPALLAKARPVPISTTGNVWVDPAETLMFWQAVGQRLFGFLGHLEPLPRSGFQLVVAVNVAEDDPALRNLAAIVHAAGIRDARVTPASAALAARWAAQIPWDRERTVIAVAVGDVATTVGAYVARPLGAERNRMRLEGLGGVSLLDNIGLAPNLDRIVHQVLQRTRDSVGADAEAAVRDGALEFGQQLFTAETDEPIEWSGPLYDRMFTNFVLSRSTPFDWLNEDRIGARISDAVQAKTRELGLREPVVIVGGMGLLWPFFFEPLRALGPIWVSASASEDVARGAALLPAFLFDAKKLAIPSATERNEPSIHRAPEDAANARSRAIPPWER